MRCTFWAETPEAEFLELHLFYFEKEIIHVCSRKVSLHLYLLRLGHSSGTHSWGSHRRKRDHSLCPLRDPTIDV